MQCICESCFRNNSTGWSGVLGSFWRPFWGWKGCGATSEAGTMVPNMHVPDHIKISRDLEQLAVNSRKIMVIFAAKLPLL